MVLMELKPLPARRHIEAPGKYWAPAWAHTQHDLGFTQSKPPIRPRIVCSDTLKDVRESWADKDLSRLAH